MSTVFQSICSVCLHWYLLWPHRPAQTCQLLREDHHQQELPRHPQQPEAHHPQEQLQKGPAHGELNL